MLEHPEMSGQEVAIAETLLHPERVVGSLADTQARLYYRFYLGTRVGDKYFCVIVKIIEDDALVLTAYFTDTVKKGRQIWPRKG